MNLRISINIFLIISFLLSFQPSFSQEKIDEELLEQLEKEVLELMEDGDIPGLSVVIVNGNQQLIKSYGYANLESRELVTPNTLFELGSCSKAFTALAITYLEQQGKVALDDKVSDYIPWFRVQHEGDPQEITIRQLLHHTSGIPWNTISKIPESDADDALEQTVRQLIGQELKKPPGKKHEYATINYDVLALIIEVVAQQSFETYLQENIIDQLQLHSTTIGKPFDSTLMSTGYKIGFFAAREYKAPLYKGNNAAGYVVSNAEDMAVWLKFQMGLLESEMYNLAQLTHERDRSVPLHDMSAYARGWEISLNGTGEIYHGGLNPNYTSYMAFRPSKQLGIAVLANSNSNFTSFIGQKLIKNLAGEEIAKGVNPTNEDDKLYSSILLVVILYILIVIGFLVKIIVDVIKGRRKYQPFNLKKAGSFARSVLIILPFLFGGYILPEAIAGFSWESILVWTPMTFGLLMKSLVVAIGISYVVYFVGLCFPDQNEYKQIAPQILLMSTLSGFANVVVIIMVTSGLDSDKELKYLIFYYALTLGIYLLGRRFVQIKLIKFTRGLIYDLSIQLVDKIFSTSYQNFERIDRGRVYTAFNDDITTIGRSTNVMLTLVTSTITGIGAFLYLASIAAWATLLTVFIIASLSLVYYFVSQSTDKYFEQARDSRNVFMRLLSGMIDGFKEISLHRNKKIEYRADVSVSAKEFKEKISMADIRFVNAFLIGESLLVLLLGFVSFGMHELFPGLPFHTLLSFVVVLLYLIGPINGILNSVPEVMRFKVAWKRVNGFILEIPANLDLNKIPEVQLRDVESIKVEGIKFQYANGKDDQVFGIGPIDLEVNRGEILFIVGGNGSGKTTLAKLLIGLYEPQEGSISINGDIVKSADLSEYFSAVFSPSYLFEKLYNVELEDKQEALSNYLKLLDLQKKVKINDSRYSTIELSGGQRKRLALLQCYLENSPVYLFDEWAADQDPGYRKFFYRTLLPEMRAMGKIVIAITHDDHYFDVADYIMRMDEGRLETYKELTLSEVD